jgi:tripartite-type tricarboxylate transporter receptor subunit TctC
MNTTDRRLLACAGLLAVLTSAPATAQPVASYPSKAIKLIVPFPPGGSTDILARTLGQKLHDAWGQPVIIDNRGGAGGEECP